MERLMPLAPAELAQTLHDTNTRLCFWLDSLKLDSAPPDQRPRAATPQQMAGLLSELMRTGQWLRTLASEKDPTLDHPTLDQELNQYRKNVERLRALLPSIHSTLLEERARLEQERARVESAAEWASCSRQTL